MTKRILLALVIGFGVAQLFHSVKNFVERRDKSDVVGILAALLMIVGGGGLFIALCWSPE